ncbi:hypothetical protein [Nocardia salmonicida]|uniref:hypothetical protein n=1 Tax=Nocardia salmonicida TaxID=53431 RepID=UPI0037900623
MTVASDWVTAGAAWRASLTPIGAESTTDQDRQPRVIDINSMTPASAARAYSRVLAGRQLLDTTSDSTAQQIAGPRILTPPEFNPRYSELTGNESPLGGVSPPPLQATQPSPTQSQPSTTTPTPAVITPTPSNPAPAAPTGELPSLPQPVAPPAANAPTLTEETPLTQPTINGGTQTSVIVPGTGGQTIDTTVTNPDGSVVKLRSVSDGQGGATVWAAYADGTHTVTYTSAPGADGKRSTETYSYSSANPSADLTGLTLGDGEGRWESEAFNPDGSSKRSLTQLMEDGKTYYTTKPTDDGGLETEAIRPGSPEFRTPWKVGEVLSDNSGWLYGIDGSEHKWDGNGSGTVFETGNRITTYGIDSWAQPYQQTIDNDRGVKVTIVTKDAQTERPWQEAIFSDLDGKNEGHYRITPAGLELIWRKAPGYKTIDQPWLNQSYSENNVIPDEFTVMSNSAGGESIFRSGVLQGTVSTDPDGTIRFKPTSDYRDRTGAALTGEIFIRPGQGPKTVMTNGRTDIYRTYRELETQFGEIPGMPWVGSGRGPIGQDYTTPAAKFGTAVMNTYVSVLPLIGAAGPGAPGVGTSWLELSKSLGKTAATAVLSAQFGRSGFDLANSGRIPGLNKGESSQIVAGIASSLGGDDFKEGNIGAGLGTLAGALVSGAAIGKAASVVIRPATAGIGTIIGRTPRNTGLAQQSLEQGSSRPVSRGQGRLGGWLAEAAKGVTGQTKELGNAVARTTAGASQKAVKYVQQRELVFEGEFAGGRSGNGGATFYSGSGRGASGQSMSTGQMGRPSTVQPFHSGSAQGAHRSDFQRHLPGYKPPVASVSLPMKPKDIALLRNPFDRSGNTATVKLEPNHRYEFHNGKNVTYVHTDSAGFPEFIDTWGSRDKNGGTAGAVMRNRALRDLQPNAVYRVNGEFWLRTDGSGLVVETYGSRLGVVSAVDRVRSSSLQNAFNRMRGDISGSPLDAGHHFRNEWGSPAEIAFYTPQRSDVNQSPGAYYRMEAEITKRMKESSASGGPGKAEFSLVLEYGAPPVRLPSGGVRPVGDVRAPWYYHTRYRMHGDRQWEEVNSIVNR